MKKIAFVISHIPDPRINKRIELMKETFITSLIYWNRETVDIWDIKHKDINNIEFKIKANYTSPIKRVGSTIRFLKNTYKELKRIKPDIIYTGNVDMLLGVYLYKILNDKNVKVVYEIADLHKLIIDTHKNIMTKMFSSILKKIERIMCKEINLLVVTSEKFYDIYYSRFIPKDKLVFIPNMPPMSAFDNYHKKREGAFTVGFIGAVRYKEQMRILMEAAKNADVKILFAGSGLDDDIENECVNNSKVQYYGKYNYDNDIAKLYGMVDCVYAVYNADLFNVRVALPNKLYESIYCELPIIVSKNTYLAELVEKMSVGIVIDHKDIQELTDMLIKIKYEKEYYNKLVDSCIKAKKTIDINIYNKILLEKLMKCFK